MPKLQKLVENSLQKRTTERVKSCITLQLAYRLFFLTLLLWLDTYDCSVLNELRVSNFAFNLYLLYCFPSLVSVGYFFGIWNKELKPGLRLSEVQETVICGILRAALNLSFPLWSCWIEDSIRMSHPI